MFFVFVWFALLDGEHLKVQAPRRCRPGYVYRDPEQLEPATVETSSPEDSDPKKDVAKKKHMSIYCFGGFQVVFPRVS